MESNLKIGDEKAIGKYVCYAQLQSMDDFQKLNLLCVSKHFSNDSYIADVASASLKQKITSGLWGFVGVFFEGGVFSFVCGGVVFKFSYKRASGLNSCYMLVEVYSSSQQKERLLL